MHKENHHLFADLTYGACATLEAMSIRETITEIRHVVLRTVQIPHGTMLHELHVTLRKLAQRCCEDGTLTALNDSGTCLTAGTWSGKIHQLQYHRTVR